MTLNKKGLTLIEILVAMVISSIIILGAYALFKSTTDIRISFKDKTDFTKIQTSLTLLFNRDLNASLNAKPDLSDYDNDKSISFVTFNSLFFNGAIPVTVTYSIKDNYLIREERNNAIDYKQVIRLIKGIKSFDVYYFNGTEYTKDNQDYKMVKVKVGFNNYKFDIIAGKFRL
jgi:prepilin-type N-terminal cleavage/methylation domain-containing protein